MRDDWAAAGACKRDEDALGFCRVALQRVQELFAASIESFGADFSPDIRYAVPQTAWDRVARLTDSELRARPTKAGLGYRRAEPEVLLEGNIRAFVATWRAAIDALLQYLHTPFAARESTKAVLSSTYGVFIPAGSRSPDEKVAGVASAHGVPQALTLPGTARVLLCSEALRTEEGDRPEVTAGLRRCTIVHEQFHAAIATSSGSGAALAIDMEAAPWVKAAEEAMAAWVELEFARRRANSGTVDAVIEYVRSGDWPSWYYRGAEIVERAYSSEGTEGVKAMLRAMLVDPVSAAFAFRAMASGDAIG
jgi:hypothetical protein